MKTNIKFPADFYEQLYNEIKGYGFKPEDEHDTTCEMEIEIGNFSVSLNATFELDYVDDSFSHEFGIEEDYHFEAGELYDIEDVVIYYDDDDLEEEVDLTDQFDYKYFWEQFKVYGTKSKGVQIHHGDEVVVKDNRRWGLWKKMIYLYTDNRLGVHVCCRRLGKSPLKVNFKCILPATTAALAIVGKGDYNLQKDV